MNSLSLDGSELVLLDSAARTVSFALADMLDGLDAAND